MSSLMRKLQKFIGHIILPFCYCLNACAIHTGIFLVCLRTSENCFSVSCSLIFFITDSFILCLPKYQRAVITVHVTVPGFTCLRGLMCIKEIICLPTFIFLEVPLV